MQKRTYYIPTIEITDIKGLNPLAFADLSNKGDYAGAPERRTPAF